jgi:PBP1b-binding outer membrane lipoprotein LpoB
MKKYRKIIISIVTLSIFNGCGSTNAYNINYTQNIEETSLNLYSTNSINIVLEKMVTSLLQTLPVDKTNRPVIVLGTVKNMTMEYIDTRNITNKIKISLLKSGLVRISLYDNDTSEIGDYKLYGDISSIEKKDGKKIDIYYKITLNLINIKSGLIVWVDEEEISIIKKFQ